MRLLLIYLSIGAIVDTIFGIYNVKKEGDALNNYVSQYYTEHGTKLAARVKLDIELIGAAILGYVLWLPAIIFVIVSIAWDYFKR